MFTSGRIASTALGLIFLWFASSSLAQENQSPALKSEPIAEPRQEQSTPASEQDSPAENQNAFEILPALENIEAAIRELIPKVDQEERERENQRNVDDLQAQQDMALWAKRMFWATLGTVLLTAVGIFLIWRTLVYSRDAADSARKMVIEAEKTTKAAQDTIEEGRLATEAAQRSADIQEEAYRRLERPYLFFEITSYCLTANRDKYWIGYTLSNHGRTPAILRSQYVRLAPNHLMDRKTREDGTPVRKSSIANSKKEYEVIPPQYTNKETPCYVEDTKPEERWDGKTALKLRLHVILHYEDPAGTYYTEETLLRCNEGAGSFRIVDRKGSMRPKQKEDEE